MIWDPSRIFRGFRFIFLELVWLLSYPRGLCCLLAIDLTLSSSFYFFIGKKNSTCSEKYTSSDGLCCRRTKWTPHRTEWFPHLSISQSTVGNVVVVLATSGRWNNLANWQILRYLHIRLRATAGGPVDLAVIPISRCVSVLQLFC